ncbi:MAG: MFS transporter [Rhodobacteraceae bacterium]|nr:MFS transporter [Paracoccaceae bacterium]
MPVALRLPWFLFALPAGIVTNRTDRRRLILAMDILRAFAFATVALMFWASLPFAPQSRAGPPCPCCLARCPDVRF